MPKKKQETISNYQIQRMKQLAIPQPSQSTYTKDVSDLARHQQSLQRTANWVDNPRDLKQRKEEEKYKKFEKEELERRRLDDEQKAYQQVLRENQLKRANQKIFQDNEKVRTLNSKLLLSDTLQGREKQVEIKEFMKEVEKKRDQFYHEETLNRVKLQEQKEKKQKQIQKGKLKVFQKDLHKQHKETKKMYVQRMREELEEGELIRAKADQAIREEEERQIGRRQKVVNNIEEIKKINVENNKLKDIQKQKQARQEEQIEQYRKKQQIILDMTKKRNQELIDAKIKQREAIYEIQAEQLRKIKNTQAERLNNQIQQMQKKEADNEKAKQQMRQKLRNQYDESLQNQLAKKKKNQDQALKQDEKFKETWKNKLNDIETREQNDKQFRKDLGKKHAQQLQKQIELKQKNRENNIRREIEQAEQVKARLEDQQDKFKSYAQKCLKEWQGNGKNVYPIIKHLSTTMKSA